VIWRLKKRGSIAQSPDRKIAKCLEWFADYDFGVADEKLGGAFFGAADDGDEAVDLATGDEAEHAAGWAGEHGPVGIFFFADFAGVFEHKDGSGLHLFRDPLVQDVQFAYHVVPLCEASPSAAKAAH
jgi:hypothetical protein